MYRSTGADRFRYVMGVGVLAAAYVGSALLGIRIAAANQLVTAVWPPSGIAVAALVIGGRRCWPGILAGAFAAEYIAGVSAPIALVIALGNTAAALFASVMVERLRIRRELDRVRDALGFFVLAGATMMLSATVGTAAFELTGVSSRPALMTWVTWWIGDAMGVILIAPVAMTLSRGRWRRGWAMNALFLVTAGAVSWELFSHTVPVRHFVIPVAIIAALYLGPRGTSLITLVVASMAIAAMAWSPNPQNFVLLQTLCASVAMTSLTLAALMNERKVMHDELKIFADDLEGRVRDRTMALERANAHLRELDATKNAILSAVSHELRTPLTAILGFTELLQTPDVRADGEMSDELIVRLDGSSRRLSRLLQDLLDLGRLESGNIEPKRETCLLRDVINSALNDLELDDHMLDVTVDGAVYVDPTHVERIVHNLVGNAVKYTPRGTTIGLVARATCDGGAMLSVSDEGPGIPEDRREGVFEPFARLGDNTHAQGAGVGLALVRRFARMHGGGAWVSASPSGGCLFTVDLPGRAPDGRVA